MIRENINKSKTKILVLGLILVVLVGLFSPVSQINAQTVTGCYNAQNVIQGNPPLDYNQCIAMGSQVHWVVVGETTTPTDTSKVQDVVDKNDCGLFSNWDTCIMNGLTRIAFIIMGVMALILWLAGTLLDSVLSFTIINMQANLDKLTGINTAWKVIRDIMNIAFIFLLVYEGIKMIIGLSDLTKIKKFVSMIVLASLLVNFSLFFTKVLIDASNVVTLGVYNSIISDPNQTPSTTKVSGLSMPFMKALGVSSFFSSTSFDDMLKNSGNGNNLLVIALLGSVVFLVVAFVFFAVACMFIIRYITLIILLMLSPVAYMGMALPFVKKYADDWWDSLNSQLLFAPIYMIMTSIILILMSSPGFISSSGNWGNLISPTGVATATSTSVAATGSISILFNFTVIIGLIIASLVIAKSTSKKGSEHISAATGKLTTFAGGAVMGGAARFGRNTAGRAGNIIANREGLKEAASKGGVGGFFAKTALRAGTKTATSSFDARSTDTFGAISSATGVKFGEGAKSKNVNFQKDLEAKAKKEAEFAKSLKPSDAATEKIRKERGQDKLEEEENKTKVSLSKSEHELKRLRDEEERLRKNIDVAVTTAEEMKIREEMTNIQNLAKIETDNIDSLKKASEKASKASKAGEEDINKIFEDRVGAYAETFENEKGMRWFKNIAKVGTGMGLGALTGIVGGTIGGAGGSTYITTKADNQEIARKIRGVLKGKSADQELKELYKKKKKEAEEKGEEWEEDEDKEKLTEEKKEETPPAPPPTLPSTPPIT
ncbi:MAG: hypothetical protein NTX96_01595 [Candidatus Zambryskibacteria bacterium]|nr:hypothetical protein [Candidatus Zambryskibacteria bacterium]